MKKNLGKLLKPGKTFETISNRMTRREFWSRRGAVAKGRFKIHRKGDKGYFVKGNRRYYCEVLGIVKTSTGLHCAYELNLGMNGGPRWFQFTYLVRVIEN